MWSSPPTVSCRNWIGQPESFRKVLGQQTDQRDDLHDWTLARVHIAIIAFGSRQNDSVRTPPRRPWVLRYQHRDHMPLVLFHHSYAYLEPGEVIHAGN
jgi:hypothetical protein